MKKSMKLESFSVGPEDPLTIGLTACAFLCSFFRKYNCWVLTLVGSGSVRYWCMW